MKKFRGIAHSFGIVYILFHSLNKLLWRTRSQRIFCINLIHCSKKKKENRWVLNAYVTCTMFSDLLCKSEIIKTRLLIIHFIEILIIIRKRTRQIDKKTCVILRYLPIKKQMILNKQKIASDITFVISMKKKYECGYLLGLFPSSDRE